MRTKKRRTPDDINYSQICAFIDPENGNINNCCRVQHYLRYVYNDASFKFWRLKLGLTQRELAKCLNTMNHYICAVETRNLHHMKLEHHFKHIVRFNSYIECLVTYILKEEIK